MTKSTGVGRGGKRAGAGRKPEERLLQPTETASAPVTSRQQTIDAFEAEALEPKAQPSAADLAKQHTELAIATLVAVAEHGSKEDGPRVTAARALLLIGHGAPKFAPTKPNQDGADAAGRPAKDSWDALLN